MSSEQTKNSKNIRKRINYDAPKESTTNKKDNISIAGGFKYKSLFDDVEISVVYLSLDGNILAINYYGAKGFGGVPDDFLGKSIYELLPKVASLSKERVQKLIETEISDRYEDKIELESGDYWFSSSFHPVKNASGETYAILVLSQNITAHHDAVEQLKLLSSMVKQSNEGIALVDLNGNIQFINQTFAEIHGYKPDELVGKKLSVFHNKDQMKSVNEATKTIRTTGEFIGEIWHKHRNGSIFPTFMHNFLLRDDSGKAIGMIGTLRDITVQKQAEEALRESEARYRQLINNAGNPIVLFDLDNRVILANGPCAENFELKPDEMAGRSIYDLLPDLADEIAERNKKVIESGQGFEIEDFVQLPSVKRWYTTNLQPAIDANGNIYGVLVLSNDITDLKESEEKLKKTSTELRIKHNDLQEKNVTLKQVLAHIEEKRHDSLFGIQREMKKAVLPQLNKLKKRLGKSYSKELESLETSLKAVLDQDKDSFRANYGTLTARESEIAELIKKGLSSKEISSKLSISIPTVFKHREQIRKKLDITNKNIGLATFLRSHL